jgi:hypothetical protein
MAHEHAGRSILDIFWEKMDEKFDALMELRDGEGADDEGYNDFVTADEDEAEDAASEWSEWVDAASSEDVDLLIRLRETKRECTALAWAIAVLTNPYKPNINAIRVEARNRWDEAGEIDEEE